MEDSDADIISRPQAFSRQDVVNAFQKAFTTIGGTTRLALWANANPDKFYPLYAKLLPSTALNLFSDVTPRVEQVLPPTPLDYHPGSDEYVFIQQRADSSGASQGSDG